MPVVWSKDCRLAVHTMDNRNGGPHGHHHTYSSNHSPILASTLLSSIISVCLGQHWTLDNPKTAFWVDDLCLLGWLRFVLGLFRLYYEIFIYIVIDQRMRLFWSLNGTIQKPTKMTIGHIRLISDGLIQIVPGYSPRWLF